jgi:hypothetical protein
MREIYMTIPIEMRDMMKIASVITHGDPTNIDLFCPYCKIGRLIFSFTVIEPPRYGLFIVCQNCQHTTHYSLGERPPNFRDDLVLEKYQHLEDEAHAFAAEKAKRTNKKSSYE